MRKKCRPRVISQKVFYKVSGIQDMLLQWSIQICKRGPCLTHCLWWVHTHTVVKAVSAPLQKICGANISTNGTTEVKVGGEHGQGKPEEKVHVDAWGQSLGQSSPNEHEDPQDKSINWASVKIRASTQHHNSLPPAARLTPCPSGAGAGVNRVRQSHGARSRASRANPGW